MVYYSLTSYNSYMFLVGIISWWYGKGFLNRIRLAKDRLRFTADKFSIDLLLRTLFNPYRQISAYAVGTSFAEKVRAYFDRLLSRIIGTIVRSFMIIFGVIILLLLVIFSLLILVLWFVIPMLPIIGLILMATGWLI